MNKYKIEFFFRHGKFEKDFEIIEIEADTIVYLVKRMTWLGS